jgi:hypothetical protein
MNPKKLQVLLEQVCLSLIVFCQLIVLFGQLNQIFSVVSASSFVLDMFEPVFVERVTPFALNELEVTIGVGLTKLLKMMLLDYFGLAFNYNTGELVLIQESRMANVTSLFGRLNVRKVLVVIELLLFA